MTQIKLATLDPVTGLIPGDQIPEHGDLVGLADDDHPQYHNDTRGDIRYYLKAAVDAIVAAEATARGDADALLIPLTQKGAASGVAQLDGTGKVPDAQIPAGITRDSELSAAIDAVLDTAPGALDTLNELAAALGDDPNFAATMTTALAGKQASDADLTAIAALNSGTAGAIASDGAGWIHKTFAQFKTALALAKADVGLANVDNTADVDKPVSTAQAAAIAAKVSASLFDANSILKANADDTPVVQTVAEQRLIGRLTGGQITDLTVAQIKTLLAYAAGDITNTPAGEIAAATVQAALNELDTEKVPTGRPFRNFIRSGRYLVPPYGNVTTTILVLSRMVSIPIWVPDAATFDRIGMSVTTAGGAGSTIRLGLHTDDGNGAPGALILDAGTIDSSTTGVKEITISQAVSRGLLWLTYVAQGGTAPTVRTGIGSNSWISGPSATSALDFALTGYRIDGIAGALPNPWGVITNADTSSGRVTLRMV